MTTFWTACRETGDLIDEFDTIQEARAQIERYEAEDMGEGIFEPRFYEVLGMDDDGCTFEISEVCE